MGISMNGPSGIDTAYIIDSLVDLEYNRVREVESKIDSYNLKIDAYSKLKGLLSDLGSKAESLNEESSFNIFKTASSNEDLATFRAGIGAVEGIYGVGVYQLAQSEKMISTDGLITSQSAALSTMGITPGDISINGVTITIDNDDTIQDMRMKINNAVDVDGNKIGVTATVLKLSDTNFRLLLTATDDGAAGATYQDVTGSALQDLGIIQDAAGSKGNTSQKLESAVDVQSAFAALGAGDTIQFAGTDRSGNAVSGLFVVGASSTIDDFLEHVEERFHGLVDASIDGAGKLVIDDKSAGSSQLSISSFSMGGVASDINIVEAGSEGDGVLNAGQDAFYSIDGLYMQADSNTPDGVISGVTLELHSVSNTEVATLDMSRDFDAIAEKIKEMFDAFNAIIRFSREETSYGSYEDDEDSEEKSKGDLAGDMTVRNIVSKLRTVFQQQFDLLGGEYTNVAMVGVQTSAQTGEISIDTDALKSALEEDYNSTINLFITKGFAGDANISMGRFTEETTHGKYTIEEPDADHLRIQLEGSTEWYMSDYRLGDVVNFSDGPAAGLTLTAPSGTLGAGSTSFTFSRGLADQINDIVDEINDGQEGLIFMRQETWRKSIDRSEDRITQLEARIESFRLRLVNQFSAMEQTLNEMQAQSANMMSALGYYA